VAAFTAWTEAGSHVYVTPVSGMEASGWGPCMGQAWTCSWSATPASSRLTYKGQVPLDSVVVHIASCKTYRIGLYDGTTKNLYYNLNDKARLIVLIRVLVCAVHLN
jgi:hypothetical protein